MDVGTRPAPVKATSTTLSPGVQSWSVGERLSLYLREAGRKISAFSPSSTARTNCLFPLFVCSLVTKERLVAMEYCLPVQFDYNGQKYLATMGPFEHSTERQFALTVNRRAIDECTSVEQLKPVAKNLLEGWSSLQTAFQSLMLENIQLRQALAVRDSSLEAADEMLTQASVVIDKYEKQLKNTNKLPWPFG